ncbi:mitochondrial carrier protein [Trypanosoma brucei equiperdum]|uniref:Mitochondrial carrier protein n=2 Tax=Trypanosoma brucei TaxID=5691 RepID=A0A3L6KT90_9TRYP|nr:mitochondrial carrier protein [Trypanosoma brucei equiperdum]
MEVVVSFLSGWAGGISNLLVGHPFDTVKTLMQGNKGEYKNSLHCAKRIVMEGGPFALYKGVIAPMTGTGVVMALYFVAYDATETLIRKLKGVDSLTPLSMGEIMLCGGSTGVLGSLVLGPAELLKVRQQTALSSGARGSLRDVILNIYRKEGPLGFTRGIGATMLRDVPGSMAWFGAYEYTKLLLCKNPKDPSVGEALFAGGMGGIAVWSFSLPLDCIKTRVQASSVPLTPVVAFRAILSEHGIKGFYRGIGPALLRAFPANAACFAARDKTKSTLNNLCGM